MSQLPLLSVIIPIYNTEAYLDKCLSSLLLQTYTNIEIILVDDGSTDASSSICDAYAIKYSFIKVLHLENGGPATAKNKGYTYAKGKYIAYIDSDDELKPEMYKLMLESAERNQADIVCCSYIQVDETGGKSHEECTGLEYILNCGEGLKHLLEKNMIYSQCWTKIYRRDILQTNQIRFIDGLKTEEDFIYNLQVFMKSNIITIVDIPLYIYTYRNSSLSRKYYKTHLENFLMNMDYRLQLTDDVISKNFPKLSEISTVHCLQYYNLMIGRAAMFPYQYSKRYLIPAFSYIRKNWKILLKFHSKCGLSFVGALLYLLLPNFLYFSYRIQKSRSS